MGFILFSQFLKCQQDKKIKENSHVLKTKRSKNKSFDFLFVVLHFSFCLLIQRRNSAQLAAGTASFFYRGHQ